MKLNSVFTTAALIATIGSASATLIAPRLLSELTQSASLIVSATAEGSVPASGGAFTLHVNRVIKGGSSLAGTDIPVTWEGGEAGLPSGATSVTTRGTGLWFLSGNADGWRLIPVVQGGVSFEHTYFPQAPGPLPQVYAYNADSPVLDKVAAEACFAVESSGPDFNFQINTLWDGSLQQLASTVPAVLYQRMANSSSPRQQALGLAGMVRGGSAPALVQATGQSKAFAAYPLEYGALLRAVRDAFRASDDASVAALGFAASTASYPSDFRQASAHALAAVHTDNTLPYLAALLSDPDANLRVEGIGGLASFANGLSAQTEATASSLSHLQLPPSAPYRTDATTAHFALGYPTIERNENFYLSFWQEWWLQNKTALGY